MDEHTVIKHVNEIYEQFSVPDFLALHMETTARIAEFMLDHWQGPPVNRERIIASLLLHDLGNVMRVNRSKFTQLFGMKDEELDALEKRQQLFAQKYGTQAKQVTRGMLNELQIDDSLMKLIEQREAQNIPEMIHDNNWEAKLACYPDLRVSPKGIVSREERYQDVLERYAHRAEEIIAREASVLELEKQVFSHLSITPQDITPKAILPYMKRSL